MLGDTVPHSHGRRRKGRGVLQVTLGPRRVAGTNPQCDGKRCHGKRDHRSANDSPKRHAGVRLFQEGDELSHCARVIEEVHHPRHDEADKNNQRSQRPSQESG